ncbi:hypothetical protein [Proteus mirabilis]|nr:hypothetical protein [Proteus mirabilis]MDH7535231.1 hypothetical protein [Proteus mirabilis]MDM3631190.1 hypothetical protein [Proteus mirabilis]MDM3642060.1 hypothetical protein [Proteus mirabilis]MDM3710555.1 hypothetical protein [Proteus mirabilis]MDM3783974.1 hypothetical protein [Proteus mirabilis]
MWKNCGNINPKDVRYIQGSIKKQTGEYTVLGNADSLLNFETI